MTLRSTLKPNLAIVILAGIGGFLIWTLIPARSCLATEQEHERRGRAEARISAGLSHIKRVRRRSARRQKSQATKGKSAARRDVSSKAFMAGEVHVPFFSISGSEFAKKFVGVIKGWF